VVAKVLQPEKPRARNCLSRVKDGRSPGSDFPFRLTRSQAAPSGNCFSFSGCGTSDCGGGGVASLFRALVF
jgi:hypothetical protein